MIRNAHGSYFSLNRVQIVKMLIFWICSSNYSVLLVMKISIEHIRKRGLYSMIFLALDK